MVAHPGWSATELLDRDDHPGPAVWVSRKATAILGSSAAAGARSQIKAAVDPEILGGSFVGPSLAVRGRPHLASASAAATDPVAASWLWETSNALTEADFNLPAAAGTAAQEPS